MTEPHDEDCARLTELLDRSLADPDACRTIDLEVCRALCPEHAEHLLALVETARALETAAQSWKGAATQADGPDPVAPAAADLPERIGRYRVLARLGAGGMGTVYKAHDPELDRVVAVKVPHFEGSPAAQDQARQRFLREARAAARVRHPHTCPLHDVGEHDGTPFAVMAFSEGSNLSDVARQGPLEPARAVDLVRKVALGLEAVHAAGVVHRDLKPGNILLDRAGEPLLTDFGLARSDGDAEPLTRDGSLLGTPAYMAPEQAS